MFRSKKPKPDQHADNPDDMVVLVDQAVDPYVVMFHDPTGYRAEQFRALRNRLLALNPDGESKVLVLSSAVRGEGKTVSAINLAMAFAELERQPVVLLDGDLRRPSVERSLNLVPGPGLSDLLLGRNTLEQVLRPGGYRGLQVIGAGAQVQNPAELLGRPRIEELFARLKERFQYVIVDTPPVLACTDAGVLAGAAEGTVLVLRLERSTKAHCQDAVRTLQDLGANVLGTLVTEVRGLGPENDSRLRYGGGD